MGRASCWAAVTLTAILCGAPRLAWAQNPPAAAAPVGPAEPGAAAAAPAPASEPAPPPTPTPPVAAPAPPAPPPPAAPAASPPPAAPPPPPGNQAVETNVAPGERRMQELPKQRKPSIRIDGLVHVLAILADRPQTPTSQFAINRARVGLKWTPAEPVEAMVEVALTQEERAGVGISGWAPLRDVFVRFAPDEAFRVRMGQFKRPFNRLRRTSLRELKLVYRGISDYWIVDALGYGDRDLGLEVDGILGKQMPLSYSVGVFNGDGENRTESDLNGAKDFVGRLEVAPIAWLSIGVDGSWKRFQRSVHPAYPKSALMGGADFAIQAGGLYVLGAGMYGDNYLSIDGYQSTSLLLMAAYKIPLTSWWGLALEPLAKGELLKVEYQLRKSHFLSGTVGANLHVGKYVRLMVQDEVVWGARNAPDLQRANFGRHWMDQHRLFMQAAVQTR